MLESKFERKVIKLIESRGGIAEHLIGNKGDRDLVCCYKGRYIALELKSPTSYYKATPIQLAKMVKLNKARAITCATHSIEDIEVILNSIDKVDDAISRLPNILSE